VRFAKLLFLKLCLLLSFQFAYADDFSRDALIAADYKQGRTAFQQRCSACHTLAEGSSDIVGPALWGIFGKQAGTGEFRNYSGAFEKADFVWSAETMGEFVADPNAMVPGNQMGIPEGVPEADRTAVVAFIMLETGAADWPRPEFEEDVFPEGATIADKYPSFYNHMMNNTTHYRMVTDEGEFIFDAYFNTDGSITTNTKARGFWHVVEGDSSDVFCYAMHKLRLKPRQFVECFPIAAMAIPRFNPELWKSNPAEGVILHGGILPGRPEQ